MVLQAAYERALWGVDSLEISLIYAILYQQGLPHWFCYISVKLVLEKEKKQCGPTLLILCAVLVTAVEWPTLWEAQARRAKSCAVH